MRRPMGANNTGIPTLIGVDPGFANFGYAATTWQNPKQGHVQDFGVFETEKSNKKQNVLSSSDNIRRMREIHMFFSTWLRRFADHASYRVIAICAESISLPRNASVSAKMGMTWGVLVSVAAELSVPIFEATPQMVKRAVTGNKSATKEEVQAALDVFIPTVLGASVTTSAAIDKFLKGQREHVADSLASVVACMSSDSIQMALRS